MAKGFDNSFSSFSAQSEKNGIPRRHRRGQPHSSHFEALSQESVAAQKKD
jgi:hypothetical protein